MRTKSMPIHTLILSLASGRSAKDIAALCGQVVGEAISPASVYSTLGRMRRHGLVVPVGPTGDRRVRPLRRSPRGEDALRRNVTLMRSVVRHAADAVPASDSVP